MQNCVIEEREETALKAVECARPLMSNCLCDGWLTTTHYAGILMSCCVSSMRAHSYFHFSNSDGPISTSFKGEEEEDSGVSFFTSDSCI